MGRLFLARHGETDWHLENRILGRTDTSLNERGLRQAELLAGRLAKEELAAIYVSPMQRCLETVAPTAAASGITPIVIEEMAEIDFGEWDGMTSEEIMAIDPVLMGDWLVSPSRFRVPGGESVPEVLERVLRGVNAVLSAHDDDANILVVSHGGPIRLTVCTALGMELDLMLRIEIDLASLCSLKFFGRSIDSHVSVACLNDTSYLAELDSGAGDVLDELRARDAATPGAEATGR
ncbi:MAG: histidine phosphatase family protein [Candidatus Geothermincolia bacterium]